MNHYAVIDAVLALDFEAVTQRIAHAVRWGIEVKESMTKVFETLKGTPEYDLLAEKFPEYAPKPEPKPEPKPVPKTSSAPIPVVHMNHCEMCQEFEGCPSSKKGRHCARFSVAKNTETTLSCKARYTWRAQQLQKSTDGEAIQEIPAAILYGLQAEAMKRLTQLQRALYETSASPTDGNAKHICSRKGVEVHRIESEHAGCDYLDMDQEDMIEKVRSSLKAGDHGILDVIIAEAERTGENARWLDVLSGVLNEKYDGETSVALDDAIRLLEEQPEYVKKSSPGRSLSREEINAIYGGR